MTRTTPAGSRARPRTLTAGIVLVVIAAFVTSLYRPWLAQWGSTTGTARGWTASAVGQSGLGTLAAAAVVVEVRAPKEPTYPRGIQHSTLVGAVAPEGGCGR